MMRYDRTEMQNWVWRREEGVIWYLIRTKALMPNDTAVHKLQPPGFKLWTLKLINREQTNLPAHPTNALTH